MSFGAAVQQGFGLMPDGGVGPAFGFLPAGVSDKTNTASDHVADPLLVLGIESLVTDLCAKAYENKRIAAESGDPEAMQEAQQHAHSLLAVAQGISMELKAAPVDARGNKKISASRAHGCVSVLQQAHHAADMEKSALVHDVGSHQQEKSKSVAKVVAASVEKPREPSILTTVRRTVRDLAPVSVPVGVAHLPTPEPMTVVHVMDRSLRSAQEIGANIGRGLHQAWEQSTAALGEAVDALQVSAPVVAMKQVGAKIADTAREAVVATKVAAGKAVDVVKETVVSVKESATEAVKSVGRKVEQAYDATGKLLAEGVDKAKRTAEGTTAWVGAKVQSSKAWIAGLLPGSAKDEKKEAVAEQKPKPAAAKDEPSALEKARKQAVVVAVVFESQLKDVKSWMEVVPQNLPDISGFWRRSPVVG